MNKGVLITLIAICAIVFSVSAYKLISYYSADRAAEKEFAELTPEGLSSKDGKDGYDIPDEYDSLLPYYKELREQNGDMVGWLRIPRTRISYPVMQTPDSPEYYLDKNFKKEFTANGSLFVNSINDVELPSDVVTIYGHRMKTGAMFGTLGDYLDADFMAEHDTIILDTFTGRNVYKVYCAFTLDVGIADVFDYYNYTNFAVVDMFDRFMGRAAGLAAAENPAYKPVFGDKVLLLSTCEYTHSNGRLVVLAVRE